MALDMSPSFKTGLSFKMVSQQKLRVITQTRAPSFSYGLKKDELNS